jgi:transposase
LAPEAGGHQEELALRWSVLLPHFAGLHIANVCVSPDAVEVHAHRIAATARCPSCQRRSRRVHSRYTRRLADAPLGGRRVAVHLQVRRFRCAAQPCGRRTFVEQVPHLAGPRARRSVPLRRMLEDVGVTIGGRPGARFAARRTIAVGRMTLLRLVRALPEPPVRSPTVLGVDDFALRRGRRYGTVLVDVGARALVDLVPERSATALTAWLTTREQPAIICRDRGGEYASGARQGAPDAIQIADRFHLQQNTSQVLERILRRQATALRACVSQEVVPDATGNETPPAVPTASTTASTTASPTRQRSAPLHQDGRRAQYDAVVALHAQGHSLTAIAAQVGLSRPTVRTYVRAGRFPERSARRTLLSPGTTHGEYVRTRWQEGVQDAQVVWDELRTRGYRGTVRTVQRAVAAWREGPALRGRHTRRLPRRATPATWDHRPPSAAQAVWWLLRPVETLTAEEQQCRQRLLAAAPDVQVALDQLLAFRQLIHERDVSALAPWLRRAEASTVAEVRAFAASVRRDRAAVQAALDHAWSSGPVEGQVTKIKLVKRQMYGRANFDLLRRRLLLAR